MSEELKDLQRRINNLESRMGGIDVQIKGFNDAMESIRTLAQSMAEVFSGGAPTLVQDAPMPVKQTTWPVLESGKFVQKLTGTIVDDIVIREVETRSGPSDIANFKFTDGVTIVRVGLWGELAAEIEKHNKGAVVTLTALSIKDPYEGVLQISSTRNTTIE